MLNAFDNLFIGLWMRLPTNCQLPEFQ